jgi:murein DD-endopeptidase MepM/ murein hydrolase activator NlpD
MKLRKKKLSFIILFFIGIAIIIYGMANMDDYGVSLSDAEQLKLAKKDKIPAQVVYSEPIPLGVNVEVKRNETLSGVLQNQGVDIIEVALAVEQINSVFDLRKLRAGQEIALELEEARTQVNAVGERDLSNDAQENEPAPKHLISLTFQPSISEIVNLEVDKKGDFVASVEKIALDEMFIKASGKIQGSFYESMIKTGVTDNVTLQLIAALSFVIDFQRDIKPNNEFEVLYQAYVKDGEVIKGRIPAYVKLKLKRREVEIFVLENADGSLAYFHANAENVKKGLLRTPINGARISSTFGNRRHPILGYSRMHAGVDFAAPTGTPIYAAGDGTIVTMARYGSFGNYIKIKHNNTYSTAYAHASRFAKGLGSGKRVRQGQVIAYVGTTGRSTGPHLHYEVHQNGRQINPQNAKFNITRKLTGEALTKFNKRKNKVLSELKTAKTRKQIENPEPAMEKPFAEPNANLETLSKED